MGNPPIIPREAENYIWGKIQIYCQSLNYANEISKIEFIKFFTEFNFGRTLQIKVG